MNYTFAIDSCWERQLLHYSINPDTQKLLGWRMAAGQALVVGYSSKIRHFVDMVLKVASCNGTTRCCTAKQMYRIDLGESI